MYDTILVTLDGTATDRAIAANVGALVEDGATIQFGIGSIPMSIGKLLAGRKDLGIHSEMFCRSHLELIEAGSVSNAHKGLHDGVSVATFALGDAKVRRNGESGKIEEFRIGDKVLAIMERSGDTLTPKAVMSGDKI